MTTWAQLRRRALSAEAKAEVQPWQELFSLRDLFARNGEIRRWENAAVEAGYAELHAVALRYCYDIKRLDLVWRQSDFMQSMIERAELTKSLTAGQVRGVLNVIGGGLKYNRGRFWKSRGRRRDRFDGYENCLVCGGPLTTDDAVARAVGDTCYRRVMGG